MVVTRFTWKMAVKTEIEFAATLCSVTHFIQHAHKEDNSTSMNVCISVFAVRCSQVQSQKDRKFIRKRQIPIRCSASHLGLSD